MSRKKTVKWSIVGSTLMIGETPGGSLTVSLVDIPRPAIDKLALTYLAGKLVRVVRLEGVDQARVMVEKLGTNGRLTRRPIDRLSDDKILKACIVNYAKIQSGVPPMDLSDAADEFEARIGPDVSVMEEDTPVMIWARSRAKQIGEAMRGE